MGGGSVRAVGSELWDEGVGGVGGVDGEECDCVGGF